MTALGALGAREYTKDIAVFLQEKEGWLKKLATESLAEMQATEYARDIAILLKHESIDVRHTAASALGKLGAKEFAPEMVKMLKTGQFHIQSSVVEALADLRFLRDMSSVWKACAFVLVGDSSTGTLKIIGTESACDIFAKWMESAK